METDIYKTEEQRNTFGEAGAGDVKDRAQHMYDETKDTMSQAYDRTAEALSGTYDQAMMYARENPGKTTLIALGVGMVLGMVLSSNRRSRVRRFGEPIVNAVSDIALEIIRGF